MATGKSFLTAICSKVARGSTDDSILSISATESANLENLMTLACFKIVLVVLFYIGKISYM